MDIVSNVAIGVGGTFLCFVAGVLFRSFLTLVFDKKPASRIWLAKKNEPIAIFITSSPIRDNEEASSLVYPTEATAAAEVALFLRDTFSSKTQIHTSDNFHPSDLQEDLLIIGGPIHNELTRHFLEKLELEKQIDGYALLGQLERKYEAETSFFAGEERLTKDYGLILRRENPYNEDKRVTLLIGSRTAGPLIAARALIDPMIRPTAKSIHSGSNFSLLVEANVVDNEPGKIKIKESW